ncbi:MAG TPA: hypothetical protein VNC16_08105 [Solirubrobacterales bacterium]|nr:hypothetical protein [Solirubrobacterales bacterium]
MKEEKSASRVRTASSSVDLSSPDVPKILEQPGIGGGLFDDAAKF